MIIGYSFYFVLGYFLSNHELQKKTKYFLYCEAVVSAVLTVFLTALVSRNTGRHVENYYSNFSINVMTMAAAIFTLAKDVCSRSHFCKRLASLSKYCFGIYLVHIFIRNILMMIGINTLTFSSVLSIIVITLIVAGTSLVISCLLHRIPVVKKWIV